VQESDSTQVTLTVGEVRGIWLRQGNTVESADLTNVLIEPTATDLSNGYTPLIQTGYVIWRANVNHKVQVERDTGNYPAGVQLWFRPDTFFSEDELKAGAANKRTITISTTAGQGSMDLNWRFKGIDWNTPIGSYSSTVTFTISAYP